MLEQIRLIGWNRKNRRRGSNVRAKISRPLRSSGTTGIFVIFCRICSWLVIESSVIFEYTQRERIHCI